MRIDWLTDTTGKPVCFATRSAVRWRVPDSLVSIEESGSSCRGAQDPRDLAVDDDGAVHLGELAQPGGGELDVEGEAAAGDLLDGAVVAEHDEGAGAATEDALEAVTQLGAGGDSGESRPQQLVVALLHCPTPVSLLLAAAVSMWPQSNRGQAAAPPRRHG